MKRPFSLIASTFSTALLLTFTLPACDVDDEGDFRSIEGELPPPDDCVCADPTDQSDPGHGRPTDPGQGRGKGKTKNQTREADGGPYYADDLRLKGPNDAEGDNDQDLEPEGDNSNQ